MSSYIPGYARAKEAIALMGLLIAGIGFWQLAPALLTVSSGESAYATITAVTTSGLGFSSLVYETSGPNTLKNSQADIYRFTVGFNDRDGSPHKALLNIASNRNSAYKVGDSVRIVFMKERPEFAYAENNLGTWVGGAFLALFGLALSFVMVVLRRHAFTPIELPPGTPAFTGSSEP